jgi:phosphatidate cytidylyltransferase
MLRYRVLTAFVLLLIVVGMICLLNPPVFAAAIAIFFIISAAEWAVLAGINTLFGRLVYVLLVILLLFAAYRLPAAPILAVACLLWLWAIAAVCSYQNGAGLLGFQQVWLKRLSGVVMIVACWKAVVLLQAAAPRWLLMVFILIWLIDTGAYFSGRRFGRHALAERISPKKTWEGFWGGVLLAVMVVAALSFLLPMTPWQRSLFVVMVAICALFAVGGDLFVSLLKRQVGLKDSGSLLPGHGGLLDRVDSTISATPVFALGFLLLKL